MEKPDYTSFDAALIAKIRGGTVKFNPLVLALSEQAKPFCRVGGDAFRVIDRRLQALRKKNIIEFENTSLTWKVKG
jgi:hypothetical protein